MSVPCGQLLSVTVLSWGREDGGSEPHAAAAGPGGWSPGQGSRSYSLTVAGSSLTRPCTPIPTPSKRPTGLPFNHPRVIFLEAPPEATGLRAAAKGSPLGSACLQLYPVRPGRQQQSSTHLARLPLTRSRRHRWTRSGATQVARSRGLGSRQHLPSSRGSRKATPWLQFLLKAPGEALPRGGASCVPVGWRAHMPPESHMAGPHGAPVLPPTTGTCLVVLKGLRLPPCRLGSPCHSRFCRQQR